MEGEKLPLWLKKRVGEVLGVGHNRAPKEAWELIRHHFGECPVETVTEQGDEKFRVVLRLPAPTEEPVSWEPVEAFRSKLRLGLEVHVSDREGETFLLLDFSAAPL